MTNCYQPIVAHFSSRVKHNIGAKYGPSFVQIAILRGGEKFSEEICKKLLTFHQMEGVECRMGVGVEWVYGFPQLKNFMKAKGEVRGMKIHEVEALVGVTRKNIRFYEEQGLLSPRRNAANGYRDYSEEEVTVLQQIKFMRKLGVPIVEIRQMQEGAYTVGDGMRRHLITLERERRNLEQARQFCEQLRDREVLLRDLNARELLMEMEQLEQSGTVFQNKQRLDARTRYVAPVAATAVMVIVMLAIIGLLIGAYCADPEEAPPLGFVIVLLSLPVMVIVGILAALRQRVEEIGKEEADNARQY